MSVRFAHLHLHSEYSLVDSTIRIKGLVDACVRQGIPAVALTDDSNMFALVKFYKACSAAGIKPIGGSDLWISAPDDPRPWRLTLLIQDHSGYLNLSRLVSRAWRDGQHSGRAMVDASWLTPEATHGLIAVLGRDSEAARIAVNQGVDIAAARLRPFAAQMADRLYLELTRTGREGEENWNAAALALAAQMDLPVIASNDVRFLLEEAHVVAGDDRKVHLRGERQRGGVPVFFALAAGAGQFEVQAIGHLRRERAQARRCDIHALVHGDACCFTVATEYGDQAMRRFGRKPGRIDHRAAAMLAVAPGARH